MEKEITEDLEDLIVGKTWWNQTGGTYSIRFVEGDILYLNCILAGGISDVKITKTNFLRSIDRAGFRRYRGKPTERVSKNYAKGRLIDSVHEIYYKAKRGECIYHKHWGMKPAGWMINMQGRMLVEAIINKQFFEVNRFMTENMVSETLL